MRGPCYCVRYWYSIDVIGQHGVSAVLESSSGVKLHQPAFGGPPESTSRTTTSQCVLDIAETYRPINCQTGRIAGSPFRGRRGHISVSNPGNSSRIPNFPVFWSKSCCKGISSKEWAQRGNKSTYYASTTAALMASHHPQASPPGGLHPHHGPPGAHPQANGHMPMQAHHKITPQHMAQLNEAVWLQIGNVAAVRNCHFRD